MKRLYDDDDCGSLTFVVDFPDSKSSYTDVQKTALKITINKKRST